MFGTNAMGFLTWDDVNMRNLALTLLLLLGAQSASADCLQDEDVEIFSELKQHFLDGDFDLFFEKADPAEVLTAETLLETKVLLVQYIGVPATCIDMYRKQYSENYVTLITVFLGENRETVYFFFSAIKVNDVFEVVGVQLSNEYEEIYKFLR
ncbi:hypothetical protein [Roseovarius rhodophyticola]|uniref:DUF4252 domain-containing protein n=1 Tax=Roseovarius rhodophyticola TaxID=3080827 RepID=A0ABZ2THH4_9RHOB|nr:hypothetical protein [Roseovarius sp. W115]MDV2928812.1 hypothetical protein [Roseovarius sp. W115]